MITFLLRLIRYDMQHCVIIRDLPKGKSLFLLVKEIYLSLVINFEKNIIVSKMTYIIKWGFFMSKKFLIQIFLQVEDEYKGKRPTAEMIRNGVIAKIEIGKIDKQVFRENVLVDIIGAEITVKEL